MGLITMMLVTPDDVVSEIVTSLVPEKSGRCKNVMCEILDVRAASTKV